MRYSKYPSYLDSGIDWLGKVPEDWEATKLKYNTNIYNGNSLNDSQKSDYENQDESISIPYVSTKDLDAKYFTIEYDNGLRIPNHSKSTFKVAKASSTLVCIEGGSAGKKLAYLNNDVCFVNKLACIESLKGQDAKYTNYFIHSSLFKYSFELATTGLIPGVSISALKNIVLLYPPFQEQQTIANYLDIATTKIDILIDKQTKLIALLKEKRQAVISTAVTRGVDSTVAMKDSGVEWLGEIPEHWILSRMKYVTVDIIDTEHKTTPFYENGTYLVARTTDVKKTKLVFSRAKYTNFDGYKEWTKRGVPKEGDILFTREAPAGEACIVPAFPILCLGQRMVLLKTNLIKILPEFILYSIYGGLSDDFIKQLSQGSTVVHFNMSDIQNIPLFELPINEQQLIVNYINEKTSRIDSLISKAVRAIDLLQEKRTALISSVVTGKIDVREGHS